MIGHKQKNGKISGLRIVPPVLIEYEKEQEQTPDEKEYEIYYKGN